MMKILSRVERIAEQATRLEKGPPNWDMTRNTTISVFDREEFARKLLREAVSLIQEDLRQNKSGQIDVPALEQHFGIKLTADVEIVTGA